MDGCFEDVIGEKLGIDPNDIELCVIIKETEGVINYCEDMCPYRACNASYDDGYELPCTVDKCFVKEYAEYLLK